MYIVDVTMLLLGIAGVSAAIGAAIWYKIIVPFDRMHQLSEELNDPGYAITDPTRRAPYQCPEIQPVAFSNDLQSLYAAAQRPVVLIPAKADRP
jgi:hypothetical protein